MTTNWRDFTRSLSAEMTRKGWPNYFLISPATMQIIREQTPDDGLNRTHILGIPFEVVSAGELNQRTLQLKRRGKIVWHIDLGEQGLSENRDERSGQTDEQVGDDAPGEPGAG